MYAIWRTVPGYLSRIEMDLHEMNKNTFVGVLLISVIDDGT